MSIPNKSLVVATLYIYVIENQKTSIYEQRQRFEIFFKFNLSTHDPEPGGPGLIPRLGQHILQHSHRFQNISGDM